MTAPGAGIESQKNSLKDQQAELDHRAEVGAERAARAKALLEDPMIVEAITFHEKATISKWVNTAPGDTQEREELWRQLHAGRVFEAYLRKTVETGNFAVVTAAQASNDGTGRNGGDSDPAT